mgnify:CR=1 FL=1
MNELDKKINAHFPGLVVRKDLVKTVKGNAIVPTYVLEYLLGQYCATSDEPTILAGIETVREILRKHYVHRGEAGRVREGFDVILADESPTAGVQLPEVVGEDVDRRIGGARIHHLLTGAFQA